MLRITPLSVHLFLGLILLCALSGAADTPDAGPATHAAGKSALKIILATPEQNIWAISDNRSHLDVIIENLSGRPIKIYDSWNSWGWFNVTLEWSADGDHGTVKHAMRGWDKNFPSNTEIPPGGAIVRPVDVSDGWTGWVAALNHKSLNLHAVYENNDKGDGWTGSAASADLTIEINDMRPAKH